VKNSSRVASRWTANQKSSASTRWAAAQAARKARLSQTSRRKARSLRRRAKRIKTATSPRQAAAVARSAARWTAVCDGSQPSPRDSRPGVSRGEANRGHIALSPSHPGRGRRRVAGGKGISSIAYALRQPSASERLVGARSLLFRDKRRQQRLAPAF